MNQRVVLPTDEEIAQARSEKGWTENRTRICGILFNSGLSAAECANLLGGISRNAVIGKVHRKGLADDGRKVPRCSNRMARGVREQPMRDPRAARFSHPRVKHDDPPPPHIDDAAISIEQRRRLLDLTDSCCHWPVGDPGQPEFFYCGAFVAQEIGERHRPYCRSHMRRAHDPTRAKRRQPEDLVPKLSRAGVNHDHRR